MKHLILFFKVILCSFFLVACGLFGSSSEEVLDKFNQLQQEQGVNLQKWTEAIEANTSRIQSLEEQLDKVNDELKSFEMEQNRAPDISALQLEINALEKKRQTLQDEIKSRESRIADFNKQIEELRKELEEKGVKVFVACDCSYESVPGVSYSQPVYGLGDTEARAESVASKKCEEFPEATFGNCAVSSINQ